MRMIQGGEQLRFPREPGAAHRIGDGRCRQHLERDIAFQPRIVGAVDLTHPAGADDAGDVEGPDL